MILEVVMLYRSEIIINICKILVNIGMPKKEKKKKKSQRNKTTSFRGISIKCARSVYERSDIGNRHRYKYSCCCRLCRLISHTSWNRRQRLTKSHLIRPDTT